MCVVTLSFLGHWEQFKAAFLEYRVVKYENTFCGFWFEKPKASSMCRNVIFVHGVLCILLLIASCSSLLSLFLVSWCLRSPWLINSAVPSYFAGGDRLSHRCRYPHYRTLLVTNTDSSPGAGPKPQLEKSEIQPLKLPSEDYPKLLQLLPSPLSVSSTHRRYHKPCSQHDWITVPRLQRALRVCALAPCSARATWQAAEGLSETVWQQPLMHVNFICLFLFPQLFLMLFSTQLGVLGIPPFPMC